MKKKLIFIATRLFWPPDSGRKVSLYQYCKGLHEQLGYEVYVFAFLEGDQGIEDSGSHPDFIKDVRVASSISSLVKIKNLMRTLSDPSVPFQCALYWSEANRNAIRAYYEKVRPEVVMIDMIRLAPYMVALDGFGCPIVLDYDDLLSKRYERQRGESEGSILGKYGTQASSIVGALASNRFLKNLLLSQESKRVRSAEDAWARRADAVLFVSEIEAKELDARLGTSKCFTATLGAETLCSSVSPRKEFDLGFVGNMHTAANQASLDYICREVLPLLPGRELRVIGVCPADVHCRYASFEQVSFSGRVDSIADELLKCRVMLAPFAYGTGIKTKVLEAMGLGIPVVTNSIGIEGMTCQPGVDLEIGEKPEELARICISLLEDSGKRVAMGDSGREYVRLNHDWRMSIESLGRCLEYALQQRSIADGGRAR